MSQEMKAELFIVIKYLIGFIYHISSVMIVAVKEIVQGQTSGFIKSLIYVWR